MQNQPDGALCAVRRIPGNRAKGTVMRFDVYVVITSDFKGEKNEDGDMVIQSGKRREFRALKQAKKFIPDWLLKSSFNPSTGAQVVLPRTGADGKPLTATIVLESQEFDDEEAARKRGLIPSKQTAPFRKVYGVQLESKPGAAPIWTLAEVKLSEVKPDPKK